jgi:arsenate reductase
VTAGAGRESEITVWFNPSCSKCRAARDLLDERDLDVRYYRYLDERFGRAELERVLEMLGIDDPRAMMRPDEPIYEELGLAEGDRDALIDAMVANPILVERPIVIRGDRAVIARPPQRLSELLDG